MNCKFCQSPRTMKYGFKAGTQYYKCNDCERKFAGRDSPEGMRFSTATIGEAMGLFYDGLSLADISRHLVATEGIYVDPATIWRWVIDETMVAVGSRKYWLWDVINVKDRFLLASHLTVSRTLTSAIAVLYEAKGRTIGLSKEIVSTG